MLAVMCTGAAMLWAGTTALAGPDSEVGVIHHLNSVGSATCAGTGTAQATVCSVIFATRNGAAQRPGDTLTGEVTISIPQTNTLTSMMWLGPSKPAIAVPASSTLCGSLLLQVSDGVPNTAPGDIFGGSEGAPLQDFAAPVSLETSGGTLDWRVGSAGTITFVVTYPDKAAGNNPAEMGSTCVASYEFTQTVR